MTRKAEWDLEDEIGSRSSQRSVRLPNWLAPQLTTAQPWEPPDKRAREVERNRRGFPYTAGTPKAGPSLVPEQKFKPGKSVAAVKREVAAQAAAAAA